MRWLNYHHLYYFWSVARLGSIGRACAELKLSQPTISAQLKALEDNLGTALFNRDQRSLRLTEAGRLVMNYADEIFSLGKELVDVLDGHATGKPLELRVGVADSIPKLIAFRLLETCQDLPEQVRIICQESRAEVLLGELALQHLDLVIADTPVPPGVKIRAYNHLLGESGVSIVGDAEHTKRYRKNFPASLKDAPFLMPLKGTVLRANLDYWLERLELRPNIVGEFQDTALCKAFASAGRGICPIPTVIEREVEAQAGLKLIGRVDGVTERYYAISVERKVKHPAVVKICEEARVKVFHEQS